MSHENFDKDITALYQQRKQQITAPEVNLSLQKITKKPRYSLLQMLSILFVGGAASFGILAIISQLSAPPPVKFTPSLSPKLRVIALENEPVTTTDDVIVIISPPLTRQKPYIAPEQPQHEKVHQTKQVQSELALTLSVDVVNVTIYPTLEQPKLSLVPLYQEQPKYPLKAIRAKQSGTVKLAYTISPLGKVKNIVIVESTVNRDLTSSAKKALSKWRYQVGAFNDDGYEIIFDFMLN